MSKYQIKPWDNPKRWLVIKCESNEEIAYLVELNISGSNQHWCSCKWFECHKAKKSEPVPHCKHITMVEDYLISSPGKSL